MTRESRAFLDLVRHAEDPTRADEERVQRALQAAVAAGVTSSVVGPGWLEGTSWGKAFANLVTFGSKLGVIAACAAGAALAAADTARLPDGPTVSRLDAPRVLGPAVSTPSAPDAIDLESGREAAQSAAPKAPTHANIRERFEPRTPTPRTTATQQTSAPALRFELDLLHRAQSALKRGDGEAALRELDSHRTADRQLHAERQALRILALCQVGRVLEARMAAADFSREHPESVHREAISSSCANRQRIREP